MYSSLISTCGLQVKCSQYWPNNGSAVYGDISVTLDGSVQYADYVVRTLRVQLVCCLSEHVSLCVHVCICMS